MLKRLIGIRLRALADSMFNRKRGGKKGAGKGFKILFAVLMAYCLVVFLGMFGVLFYSLCQPFAQMGVSWLYFGMAGMLATALCFMGSVFFTQSTVFDVKDNDLLLSLPIKPGAILGSRLITLLLLNYAYALVVMLPCGVVWCMLMPVSVPGVLLFILCVLLLPLLPSTLSCVIGWVIALVTSRLRSKNLFTLILSFAFLGAYFFLYANASRYIQTLIQNGEAVAQVIRQSVPPIYALGMAIAQRDFSQLLVFALWCLAPFAAIYAVLSRSFVRIATMKRGAKKVKYRARALRASSALRALTVKELRHFFSNAMYILNAALGVVMMAVAAGVVLIKRGDVVDFLLSEFAVGFDFAPLIAPLSCAVLCALASFNMVSAPSISLEGKNLWIAQSIPVKAGDILLAKAYTHMIVCIPVGLLASVAFVVALPMNAFGVVSVLLAPALVSAFSALSGVLINLRLPRFDFINDVIAVKQGASSIVSMLAGMGAVALPVIACIFLGKYCPIDYIIAAYMALLLAINAGMYAYLARGARGAFAALDQD